MPLDSPHSQTSLPGFCPIAAAVSAMASAGVEARGAVFTRCEVVEFILDLAGYTIDKPLHRTQLLEPSVGQGDFLTPVIERLLAAYERVPAKQRRGVVQDLGDCITAVELHQASFNDACALVQRVLCENGISTRDAKALCKRWMVQGDFLLLSLERTYTHAIGNPPYVRQELIPDVLMAEYRSRYSTIYDRADIYIPFIERSLSLLAPGGQLGFICADRWMKNRYGGPLRRFVAAKFPPAVFCGHGGHERLPLRRDCLSGHHCCRPRKACSHSHCIQAAHQRGWASYACCRNDRPEARQRGRRKRSRTGRAWQ